MPVGALQYPNLLVKAEELPCSFSFGVAFGLILSVEKPYRIEVDIFYDDVSLLQEDREAISSVTIQAGITQRHDYVSIDNLELMNVPIKSEGMHKISASLFTGKEISDTKTFLHKQECYFFVSKDWVQK